MYQTFAEVTLYNTNQVFFFLNQRLFFSFIFRRALG